MLSSERHATNTTRERPPGGNRERWKVVPGRRLKRTGVGESAQQAGERYERRYAEESTCRAGSGCEEAEREKRRSRGPACMPGKRRVLSLLSEGKALLSML